MFIINPGTEPQAGTTVVNAIEATRRFCKALNMDATFERDAKRDGGDGWYGFIIKANDKEVEVDVPGIDPDITEKGIPFTSPRLYVDGSSWLWGYALDAASERLQKEAL